MKQSVYLQIVEDMKRKIELGLLKEDERLPSCRDLALKMGINPNTVQRAYSTLEEDGWIYTIEKKGVYVSAKDKQNRILEIAEEKLLELKEAGVTRETLESMIEKIYEEKL